MVKTYFPCGTAQARPAFRNRNHVVLCGLCSAGITASFSGNAKHTPKMENLQINLACRKFWIYVAVIVIIIVLSRDFGCTCKPQNFDCKLYMTLPSFIIFIFVLWTDRSFQRVCRHLISNIRGNWLHSLSFLKSSLQYIVRAAFISLLWAVYVFLDGDWYVCCMNNLSEPQAQLPCKSFGITDKERVIITELQNKSRVSVFFIKLKKNNC